MQNFAMIEKKTNIVLRMSDPNMIKFDLFQVNYIFAVGSVS